MSLTRTEQAELIPPTVKFVPYRCDFCRVSYMRPEGDDLCPGCQIRPMQVTGAWLKYEAGK